MSVHRVRKRVPHYRAEPTPAPETGPVEQLVQVVPRDLWSAVDRITQPVRERLWRDDGSSEQLMLPSLWDQLVEAIDSGAGKHTRGGQRSKAPCDDSALSLTVAIASAVRDGCYRLGIKRSRDVPKDLRLIVAQINRGRDQASMRTTLTLLQSWAGRIRATISNDPDRTWRMHGAACTVCSSTTVPVWDEEDETETRQPAMIVHSEHGVIDRLECGFCGSKLTGPDLTAIVLDTLKPKPADQDTDDRDVV